ncbi:UNVERIFIED_CONTAM: hypothetical protein Slati_2695500 [Sesamum latifolium]|uniref:Uncharacterized protein n=1 Tax=Sesamum latifolium TaxID=2727402 RepID=A0AAW2VW94_9LAMI
MEQCRQGSRQNGSVTREKDWLWAGHGGPSSEPVGFRRTARAARRARAVVCGAPGGRTGNGPLGGLPRRRTVDSRTGTDKGNPMFN